MQSKEYWAMRSAQDMVRLMNTAEHAADIMEQAAQKAADVIKNEVKAVVRGLQGFGISEADALMIIRNSPDVQIMQKFRMMAQQIKDAEQRNAMLQAINSAGAYRYRINRLKGLWDDIERLCNDVYGIQIGQTRYALSTVMRDAYNHGMFNLQQRCDVTFSFNLISDEAIKQILENHWLGDNYSQRIWRDTQAIAAKIKEETLLSMLTGRSALKTAQAIQLAFNVSNYCARRIVRTESAYVAGRAQLMVYQECGIEQYMFVATLDRRTSKICQRLDGKTFYTSEAKVGTNYPPMHPFCRSTTVEDIDHDELLYLQRRARNSKGEDILVPATMTYAEWAKIYLVA